MNARLNAPCAEPCSSTRSALPGLRDNNNATEACSTSDKWPDSHTNKSGPCARLSSSPPATRCGTGSPDHFEWFRHRDILRFLRHWAVTCAFYASPESHLACRRAGVWSCRRPESASRPCSLPSARVWRSVCLMVPPELRGGRSRPHVRVLVKPRVRGRRHA